MESRVYAKILPPAILPSSHAECEDVRSWAEIRRFLQNFVPYVRLKLTNDTKSETISPDWCPITYVWRKMATLIRKSYTLSPGLIAQIDDLAEKSNENDLHLSDSHIVRLALRKGLPLVSENLGLEVESDDSPAEPSLI